MLIFLYNGSVLKYVIKVKFELYVK